MEKLIHYETKTRDYALTKAKDAQGFFYEFTYWIGKTLASVAWALEHAKHH